MKKIIQQVFSFMTKIWHKGREFIKEHIEPAVDIINKIKLAVYSDEADYIVKIIPGQWDDLLLAWMRAAFPIAIEAVGIILDCDEYTTPQEFFVCLVEKIRANPELQTPGKWRDFAAQLALAKAQVQQYEHDLELKNVNLAIELYYNKAY